MKLLLTLSLSVLLNRVAGQSTTTYVEGYAQCGGEFYTGPTICTSGYTCFDDDFSYIYQCLPITTASAVSSTLVTVEASTTSTSSASAAITYASLYAQCRTTYFEGLPPISCSPGLNCSILNPYYAQCLEPTDTSSGLSSTSSSKSSSSSSSKSSSSSSSKSSSSPTKTSSTLTTITSPPTTTTSISTAYAYGGCSFYYNDITYACPAGYACQTYDPPYEMACLPITTSTSTPVAKRFQNRDENKKHSSSTTSKSSSSSSSSSTIPTSTSSTTLTTITTSPAPTSSASLSTAEPYGECSNFYMTTSLECPEGQYCEDVDFSYEWQCQPITPTAPATTASNLSASAIVVERR